MAALLLGAGIIWLLREIGIFSAQNTAVLARLWPLILIGIGLELLIGRRASASSGLFIGGAILLVLALMSVGPAIGLAPSFEVQTRTINEPLGETASATVVLGLGVGETRVSALEDSSALIDAEIRYIGDLTYVFRPGESASIALSSGPVSARGEDWFGWLIGPDERDLGWDVRLSAAVPLDLTLQGGVGRTRLELAALRISRLTINTGVGDSHIILPRTESPIAVLINGGVGRTTLALTSETFVDAEINGGVGDTIIQVSADAPVRVRVESGLGAQTLPSSWVRVSGDDRSGVWESPTFSAADGTRRSTIHYNGGVGGLRIG